MRWILFSILISSSAQALDCATLASRKGSVEILRRGAEHISGETRVGFKVKNDNESVQCDDVVITRPDSAVVVVFPDAKVALGPDSRIDIYVAMTANEKQKAVKKNAETQASRAEIQNAKKTITLTYGRVRAVYKSNPTIAKDVMVKDLPFKVQTRTAVAGVRGTDFFVSYDPNTSKTQQATIEGQVEVKHLETEQAVIVKTGQQVMVMSPPMAISEKTEPVVMKVIDEPIKASIRIASAVAVQEEEFVQPKAVEMLGKPETWSMEREPLPQDFKKMKNEF